MTSSTRPPSTGSPSTPDRRWLRTPPGERIGKTYADLCLTRTPLPSALTRSRSQHSYSGFAVTARSLGQTRFRCALSRYAVDLRRAAQLLALPRRSTSLSAGSDANRVGNVETNRTQLNHDATVDEHNPLDTMRLRVIEPQHHQLVGDQLRSRRPARPQAYESSRDSPDRMYSGCSAGPMTQQRRRSDLRRYARALKRSKSAEIGCADHTFERHLRSACCSPAIARSCR
jgi:hypothetical protein